MKNITPSQLLDFARTIDGGTVLTLGSKKPFTVRLAGDGLEYIPESTKKPRRHELRWLERVCAKYSQTNSLSPGDYHDVTVNASYTLALIAAFMKRDDHTPIFTTEEVLVIDQYWEGALRRISVNAYERDATARRACIAHFGASCQVCGFDFKATYGELGSGFIQVHHTRPLSQVRSGYNVDPESDLIPVCPNCHAMLHQTTPPLTVAELQKHLRPATNASSS